MLVFAAEKYPNYFTFGRYALNVYNVVAKHVKFHQNFLCEARISDIVCGDMAALVCIVEDSSPAMFWIFPYFMESRIVEALPGWSMLDYKVS